MSKFKPPFQQGGGTWRPPIVRFSGVREGTPEYDALLDEYRPQLRHLYLTAARAHALGITDQSKRRRETDDARMVYRNLNGQEFIDVELHPGVGGKPSPPPPETPWDWAIVDFDITLMIETYQEYGPYPGPGPTYDDTTRSRFYAVQTFPPPRPPEELPLGLPYGEAGWGVGGTASGEVSTTGDHRPVLEWAVGEDDAVAGPASGVRSDGRVVKSLKIDMRGFHAFDVISFNIYASLDAMPDNHRYDWYQEGWSIVTYPATPADLTDGFGNPTPATFTDSTGVVPGGTPDPYGNYQNVVPPNPTDGLPTHGVGSLSSYDDPLPAFDILFGATIDWTIGASRDIYQGQSFFFTEPAGHVRWDFHENILHNRWGAAMDFNETDIPVVPTSPLDIKAALFRGNPSWSTDLLTSVPSGDFDTKWYIQPQYPQRFGVGLVETGVTIEQRISALEGQPAPYGLRLLGKLSLSPKRGGAPWFNPA